MDDLRTLGIRYFLQQAKEIITEGGRKHRGWVLVRRDENLRCVTELGLNYDGLESLILGLSVTDYCEGPLDDRDFPGELWVFGKVIEEREIYIKLRLAVLGSSRLVRIVSFHEARESLYYPYRG